MNTSFFDESHFEDLLAKVRERSKSTGTGMTQQAVQDQMQRLFSEDQAGIKEASADGLRDSTEELNLVKILTFVMP